jgi:hypothetical protein
MMDWTDVLESSFYINSLVPFENACRLYVASSFSVLTLSVMERTNATPNAG